MNKLDLYVGIAVAAIAGTALVALVTAKLMGY